MSVIILVFLVIVFALALRQAVVEYVCWRSSGRAAVCTTLLRGTLLGGVSGLLLACGGLDFGGGKLEDIDREQALSAGYPVPEGAEHIYVYDHEEPDRRTTSVRFTVPESVFEQLMETLRASAPDSEHRSWQVPVGWPDFGRHQAPPDWWQPTGAVVFRTSTAAGAPGTATTTGRGAMTAFDASTHTVFLWTWHWEGWGRVRATYAPVVIELSDPGVPATAILSCENGYRQRRILADGAAEFEKAPAEDLCRLELTGDGWTQTVGVSQARHVTCDTTADSVTCTAE